MEEQAQTLLAALRKSSVPIETKLTSFNNLKSSIKHLRVPEAAQAAIFECIKLAISSQTSPTLVSTGFATLGHLIKRLSLQEQTTVITAQAPKLLPTLLDRLGDSRESHRNAASQCLSDVWPACPADVEKTIREGAIAGNNVRAKEMGMLWVVKMNRDQGLQFRSFVPFLVACLEDPDGSVRETAKSAVVELFRNAPEHAKADLKKQMTNRGVRKTIESFIISQLGIRNSGDVDLAASTISLPVIPSDSFQADPGLADSIMSELPPPQETVPMDPLYVHTQRELEDIFKEMAPHFEGRETEHNWMARDKDILKLRRLNKGNAPSEFLAAFVIGVKSLLDGILKVANSLRTTVSTNGCQCVQELARSLGPSLDPMVEMIIQTFIKMSANTKPIASNNGNMTVEVLLSNVSYKERLMQHMWFSFQDKNVQTRTYAAGWLKTLIKKHAPQKAHFEHSGGTDLAEKCLKKGLADANPKVRESTRGTYWAFAQIWPVRAEAIMDTLDAKSKQLLENDKNNPNVTSLASSVSSSTSTRPAFNGRASVREAIAAQRRAAAAATKAMPDRPTSAQSILSPMTSQSSSSSRPGAPRSATARPAVASAAASLERPARIHAPSNSTSGTLMAAPVRRPRRPELARPATADPYAASRRAGAQATPTMSPAGSPSKAKISTATKTRTPAPTTGQASGASSTVRSKSRLGESHIPRPSPKGRSSTTGLGSPMSTPSKDENLTMVVPFTQPPDDDESHAAPLRRIARLDKSMSMDGGRQSFDPDGADFTMVLPNLRSQPFETRPMSSDGPHQSITPRQSPIKYPSASARLASPSTSRLRSPQIYSAQRTVSGITDSDAQAVAEPVQIYEDPFSEQAFADSNVAPAKPVLEELPINERSNERASTPDLPTAPNLTQSTRSNEQNIALGPPGPSTPSRTPRKPNGEATASGRPDAETLRSRRLLASGIERIRGKTLDAHGFRRVQDLVKTGGDIWGDESQRYGELLLALLDYLETPNEALKAVAKGNTQNLKTQVLATVRAMMALYRREAQPYAARALCGVLASRRWERDSEHLAQEMEKACEGMVGMVDVEEGIGAVVDVVESMGAPQSPSSSASSSGGGGDMPPPPLSASKDGEDGARNGRTVVLSLSVLDQLLQEAGRKGVDVPPGMTQRLGQLAVRFLHDGDADVRRADLEFCLALHERFGGEGFWKAVVGVKEMHLNLITYYLARRGRA